MKLDRKVVISLALLFLVCLLHKVFSKKETFVNEIKNNNEPGLLAHVNLNKLLPIYIFKNGVLKEKKKLL